MTEQWFVQLVAGWIGLGLVAFVALQFVDAPYGKQYGARTARAWGPGVPNRLGWFVMEAVVLVSFFGTFATMNAAWSSPTLLFAALLTAHYVNRALIYPWRTRTRGKRMPLSVVLMSVVFNTMNGFLLGWEFALYADRGLSWFADPRFVLGALLFVGGMALNLHSDNLLIGLRKGGDTGYHVPRGGGFRWVSSPNLLGEIVEWAGFALLTWTWSGLAFFVWTCANLVPRARANHRWYRERFADYPPERRALVPGIW